MAARSQACRVERPAVSTGAGRPSDGRARQRQLSPLMPASFTTAAPFCRSSIDVVDRYLPTALCEHSGDALPDTAARTGDEHP